MAKEYVERSLLDLRRAYGPEEACAEHFARQWWPGGIVCLRPRCGGAWHLPGCQRIMS